MVISEIAAVVTLKSKSVLLKIVYRLFLILRDGAWHDDAFAHRDDDGDVSSRSRSL